MKVRKQQKQEEKKKAGASKTDAKGAAATQKITGSAKPGDVVKQGSSGQG